uniref:Uncharacterized protein n=1 Tax=Tetraselmis sp. GSL018 TaxID=582737 RepID=A0A061QYJ3_9CHLO
MNSNISKSLQHSLPPLLRRVLLKRPAVNTKAYDFGAAHRRRGRYTQLPVERTECVCRTQMTSPNGPQAWSLISAGTLSSWQTRQRRLSSTVQAKKKKSKGKSETADSVVEVGPVSELPDDEEFFSDLEDSDSDSDEFFEGPSICTAGVDWGETALKVAKETLQRPDMQGLEIYSFKAAPSSQSVRLRVDKLEDEYGSPSLEDIARVSRAMSAGLEAELGEEAAGAIEVEVSSPGAERVLRLPDDLTRFQPLPLQVEYTREDGNPDTRVFRLIEYDSEGGETKWGLADVAVNRQGKKKGQGLNRREREMVFDIPVSDLRKVRVYLEV